MIILFQMDQQMIPQNKNKNCHTKKEEKLKQKIDCKQANHC